MKFSDYAPTSSELVLLHEPTQQPFIQPDGKSASLTIVGEFSEQYEKALKVAQTKITSDDESGTIADMFDDIYRQLVIGWSHDKFFEGKFTEAKFKKIWETRGDVRRQVREVVQNSAHFFRKLDGASTVVSDTDDETGHSAGEREHTETGADS